MFRPLSHTHCRQGPGRVSPPRSSPLDRLRGAESFVEFCTVSNIFQFDLKVCAALTRLGVLDLGGAPKPALMLDDIARSDCVAVDFHRSVAAVLLKFSSGAVYRPLRMRAQWRA